MAALSAGLPVTNHAGDAVQVITSDKGGKGWLRSTVVERRSLTGELSLSCARPAADSDE